MPNFSWPISFLLLCSKAVITVGISTFPVSCVLVSLLSGRASLSGRTIPDIQGWTMAWRADLSLLLFLNIRFIYLLSVWICVCTCHSLDMEFKEQLTGMGSLFWHLAPGLNAHFRAWPNCIYPLGHLAIPDLTTSSVWNPSLPVCMKF